MKKRPIHCTLHKSFNWGKLQNVKKNKHSFFNSLFVEHKGKYIQSYITFIKIEFTT